MHNQFLVENYDRTLIINGRKIENIHFFDSTGIVFSVNRSYFDFIDAYLSERPKEIMELVFERKRSLNFSKWYKEGFNFSATDADGKFSAFINTENLDGFRVLGEQVATNSSTKINYGNFCEFYITVTTGEYKLVKLMQAYYTRCEFTELGTKINNLNELLNKTDIPSLSNQDIEYIKDNKESIIAAINDL